MTGHHPMMDEDTREDVSALIAEEKEALSSYKALCARYTISPDPIAIAVSEAKVQILQKLMKGSRLSRKLTER
jgi:hypothetical protein